MIATDIDMAIAQVQDAIYSLSGHRTNAALFRKLLAHSRWEIAIAVDHELDDLDGRIIKAIAYQQLRNEPPS